MLVAFTPVPLLPAPLWWSRRTLLRTRRELALWRARHELALFCRAPLRLGALVAAGLTTLDGVEPTLRRPLRSGPLGSPVSR